MANEIKAVLFDCVSIQIPLPQMLETNNLQSLGNEFSLFFISINPKKIDCKFSTCSPL